MATTGTTTLTIPKPTVGTLTLGTLPSGWTATQTSTGWVVTTTGSLQPGASVSIPTTYTPSTTTTEDTTVTFSATVASAGEDPANNTNNTARATTIVSPAADLYSEPRTPQPNNHAAKTVLYRWGNYGPQKTTEDAVWTVTITQTAGTKETSSLRIESDHQPWRTYASATYVDSVNAAGCKVTTYTITLSSGLPANTWVRAHIDFPGAVVGGERWTVESVAQFRDIDDSNNNFTDKE